MKKKCFLFFVTFIPLVISCGGSNTTDKIKVTNKGSNVCYSSLNDEVERNTEYSVEVKPTDGYVLSEYCFKVEIGGYTYYKDPTSQFETSVFKYANNKITINKAFVISDITIVAYPRLIGDEGFYVRTQGSEVTFNPVSGVANTESDYKLKATANDGYQLDKENMTVTIGNKTYSVGDGAFDIDENGNITIYKDYINGNITVTCNAKMGLINITTLGWFCSFAPSSDAISGDKDYSLLVMADSGAPTAISEYSIYFKRGNQILHYNPETMSYNGGSGGGILTLKREFINNYSSASDKDFCICLDLKENPVDPSEIEVFDIDTTPIPGGGGGGGISINPSTKNPTSNEPFDFDLIPDEEGEKIDIDTIEITVKDPDGTIHTYHPGDEVPGGGEITVTENEDGSATVHIPEGGVTGDISVDAKTEEKEDVIHVYLSGTGVTYGEGITEDIAYQNKLYEIEVALNSEDYKDLKKDNFKITINGTETEIDPQYFNYESGKIIVSAEALTSDVKELYITCTPDEQDKYYKIEYEYDKDKVQLNSAPDQIISTEDLKVNLDNLDSSNGLKITVTSGDTEITYVLDNNENNNYTINVNHDDYIGDMKIKIEAIANAITFSSTNPIELTNYENSSVITFENNFGSLQCEDHTNGAVEIETNENDPNNKTLVFKSNSNKVCDENGYVTFSNGWYSYDFKVCVKHPASLQSALDSTTLALIKGDQKQYEKTFDITLGYGNSSNDIDTFMSYLETTSNMKWNENDQSGLKGSVSKDGDYNKYTFTLNNMPTHGKDYAYEEITKDEDGISHVYDNIPTVNYLNRNGKSGTKSVLPIDKLDLRELTVHNSDELFWAIEHDYKPLFTYETKSMAAQNIYNKAREVVKQFNYSKDYEELRAIYEYLLENVSLNCLHYNKKTATTDNEWYKYKSFFLEGVFPEDGTKGIATADGLSKAFTLLCKIDGYNCIRAFGNKIVNGVKTNEMHSWNYVKIQNKGWNWYLVDPSSGKNIESNVFGSYHELSNYDAFLVSKGYYKETLSSDGIEYSDNTWPDIARCEKDRFDNNLDYDNFIWYNESQTLTSYTYDLGSQEDVLALIKFLMENYDGTYNVCISFYNLDYLTSKEEIEKWFAYAYEQTGFLIKYDTTVFSNSDGSYCNFVYKKIN